MALELFKSMIELEEINRPSTKEILQHPFLTSILNKPPIVAAVVPRPRANSPLARRKVSRPTMPNFDSINMIMEKVEMSEE